MTFRKLISLFALCFIAIHSYCQNDFQVKNLAAFCKYWGFLKYYHPAPSKKNIDWDTVLTNNYEKVKNAKTKEEFNSVLLSISKKLGELKPNKHFYNPPDSLSINADFIWMTDSTLFNSETIKFLEEVKQNHLPFKNKYITTSFPEGTTKVNEKPYPEMVYPIESFRFLSLSRYWNIIQYYFPSKYLMDTNWNTSLKRAVPLFINAKDTFDYYRAIEWITAKTNDSHASYVSSKNDVYGMHERKLFPFSTFFHSDTLFIYFIPCDSISTLFNIKKGDAIININGKSIKELWENVKEHHSASNQGFLEFGYSQINTIASTVKDSSELTLVRNGKIINTYVHNYSFKQLLTFWKYITHWDTLPYRILTDSISGKQYGYINMGYFKEKDIKPFFKVGNNLPYIIIDARNYPCQFVWPDLADKLIPTKKYVAEYTQPDYDHPGYIKYYTHPFFGFFKNTVGGTHNYSYKGKVIILINHRTMSAAEYETMGLKLAPNSTVIGTQTAGADGNVSTIIFPGNYSVWFTGLGWYYADGKQTQRIGITPDIKIDETVKSALSDKDLIMERALELIRTDK